MPRRSVKRDDIEDSAIRLFSTKGLARTTIKDIASAAGVTEGALYRYYDGKEEMAWKLFNRELDKFTQLLAQQLFDDRNTFTLRLGLAIQTIYDYYLFNTSQFSFILLTQHGFPDSKLLSRETDPLDLIIRFLGQAIGTGEIPPCDADLSASMLMGAVLQPLILHRYGRMEITRKTHTQVTLACLRILGING